MNTPDNVNADNGADDLNNDQPAPHHRADSVDADGQIGQTDDPDTEGWDEATEASNPAFTLEPEKGISPEPKNDSSTGKGKEDYNAKQ